MGIFYKNISVSKIFVGTERILQKRDNTEKIFYSDSDIIVGVSVNQSNRNTVGNVVLTFNKVVNAKATWNVGNNIKLITSYSANNITKQFATNVDNNGPGNGISTESFSGSYIYFIDKTGITSLAISSTGSGISGVVIEYLGLPELTSVTFSVYSNPNFVLLQNIPLVRSLDMMISGGAFSGLNFLLASNLVALALRGFNSQQPALLANLPPSLYSLEITQMTSFSIDLKDYFTGNRISLNLSSTSVAAVTYTGGAIFPSVIADTAFFRINYIYQQAALKLNGEGVSRFIVDFANQVTAVNLGNPVAKRMRFAGATPDTAYTDNSKPFYKTYTDAYNFITKTVANGGLGVSISF